MYTPTNPEGDLSVHWDLGRGAGRGTELYLTTRRLKVKHGSSLHLRERGGQYHRKSSLSLGLLLSFHSFEDGGKEGATAE